MSESNLDNKSEQRSSLREMLSEETILKGVEVEDNFLICFDDDRKSFVKSSSETIAWVALNQNVGRGQYSRLGMDRVKFDQFTKLLRSSPNYEIIQSMRVKKYLEGGSKDYLTISVKEGNVTYLWWPSAGLTSGRSGRRNVLIAKIKSKAIEKLVKIAEEKPKEVYELLISSLYPNSLIPLSDQEIIKAVNDEGPDLLRLAGINHPQMVEQYKEGLANPETLVEYVRSKSVLKRNKPCEKVDVKIV